MSTGREILSDFFFTKNILYLKSFKRLLQITTEELELDKLANFF